MQIVGLPEVVSVEKEKCEHCLACVQTCPVKLCNIVEPDGVKVNSDLCIGCGECVKACHQKGHGARNGVDDFPALLKDLQSGKPIGVLLAPSAAVNYPLLVPQLITAIKNMGVKAVFDVSFGAEITTYQYVKALRSGVKQPVIAQPCPAIVNFIEIYHPELISYLAPSHSPALDAAIWVKNQPQFGGLKLAFVGPCLAKRREFHDPNTKGMVSYNVTFQSLDRHFIQQMIKLETLPSSPFDTPEAERAIIYSQPGGLTETFQRFGIAVKKSDLQRSEGPQEVYDHYIPQLKEDIRHGEGPLLVDILNCLHGCNVGPAVTHNLSRTKIDRLMEERKEEQEQKHKGSLFSKPRDVLKKFYGELDTQNLDFSRKYTAKSQYR